MPTGHFIKVISSSKEPYEGYGILTLQLKKQLESCDLAERELVCKSFIS